MVAFQEDGAEERQSVAGSKQGSRFREPISRQEKVIGTFSRLY
jgi:hypothetical protein